MQLVGLGAGDIPHRAVTTGDINDLRTGCSFCCSTESVLCTAGEIIVLQVEGEVDLCTLPILQTALGDSLDHHPALVDLAQMTFCSARGMDLLTQTGHTTAGQATSFAVCGVSPQLDRIWSVVWEGDLPIGHRSTAAAMTALGAAE
jgi:anti-anti-sigma factor